MTEINSLSLMGSASGTHRHFSVSPLKTGHSRGHLVPESVPIPTGKKRVARTTELPTMATASSREATTAVMSQG